MSIRAKMFTMIGRFSPQLPAFRGRTRMFLTLFDLLRLSHDHVYVKTRLRRPTPFLAQLDLHSWLQRIAFLTGGYEEDTVSFLYRLHSSLGQRGYCLDIGANVGLISIPLALLLMKGSTSLSPCVVAIEAVPDNCRALEANVALNILDKEILILPTALGDVAKAVEIQVEGDLRAGLGTGTANILPDGSTYECVRQLLQLHTLDSILAEGQLPTGCSVMKIDTDGYDLNA